MARIPLGSLRSNLAGLILLAFLGAHASAQTPAVGVARDWKLFPAVVEVPATHQLYAMGDVHGDYDKMVQLLVGTRLIAGVPATPDAVRWNGGDAVLVCTGDFIDKYNHAISVIALLRALQPEALAAGGRVVITVGNHEAEFLAGGGMDKKGADFEDELSSAGLSPSEVAAGRDSGGIGIWLRRLPAAAKVGDWFFCHAGNTGGMTAAQLEEEIETQVTQKGFDCPILVGDNSLLEARLHPRPWWDWDGQAPSLKDESQIAEPKHSKKEGGTDPGEGRLRAGIEALGVHHLVFGHQPGKIKFADGTEREAGAMYEKFDGLVFLIDTGMSRGVDDGKGAVLKITDDSAHGVAAIYADGAVKTLVK